MRCRMYIAAVVLLFGGAGCSRGQGGFALKDFDEAFMTCRAAGRLQDKQYCQSKMEDEIVAAGKAAVPILISQLTDAQQIPTPLFDYWTTMTVGDLAQVVLMDLFTEADEKTTTLTGLKRFFVPCGLTYEMCWHAFVKKHGMKYVQSQWLALWAANKDRVYWDEHARCFRLSARKRRGR